MLPKVLLRRGFVDIFDYLLDEGAVGKPQRPLGRITAPKSARAQREHPTYIGNRTLKRALRLNRSPL
jgi:hypothetical protein